MDRKLLREKLKQALRVTLKGALVLSPMGLLSCQPGPFQLPDGGSTFVQSETFPVDPDAGRILDAGCSDFCQSNIPSVDKDSTNAVFANCQGVVTLSDGGEAVICDYAIQGGIGRRLAWLEPGRVEPAATLAGALFAEAARFEAASVTAFQHLGAELRRHGAPRSLLNRARVAAADEVRHARVTARLARRFGGTPTRPQFGAAPVSRSLEALALENAVEGCVRETHGAVVAEWQSRFARDRGVGRTLAAIAKDEMRHAELGWSVAAWAEPKLSRAARRRVRDGRNATLAGLAAEVDREVPEELVRVAGLPNRELGRALAANLARELRG